jgi:hypothetical protein
MLPLKVNDPQLAPTVQCTLTILLDHGISTAGKHHLLATKAASMRLSSHQFRELVSAGVAKVTNGSGGQVLRHMAPVAEVVELFTSGDIAVTLSFDITK